MKPAPTSNTAYRLPVCHRAAAIPDPIIKKVHAISGGIPRLINILCDRMLLGAYTQETTQIDHNIYKQATLEVMGERSRPSQPNYQTHFYLAAIGLWFAGGGFAHLASARPAT